MSLKFDCSAPGGGIEVKYRLENGKAFLQFAFRFIKEPTGQDIVLRLHLINREGQTVLECFQRADEEEPLRAVLLQPCLWQGVENPHLYRMEADLILPTGEICDRSVRRIAFCQLEEIPGKGFFLNGNPFFPKVVRYRIEEFAGGQSSDTSPAAGVGNNAPLYLLRDMELIRGMGANAVLPEGKMKSDEGFRQLCEQMGLLVWKSESLMERRGDIPLFFRRATPQKEQEVSGESGCGQEKNQLLRQDGTPSSLYYKYRARWTDKPFVYLAPESIRQQKNGRFSAVVYSNCKKVALYSDGVLHEFKMGETEFFFREITGEGPCLTLTAEAQECAHSVSVHKTFTDLSLFHDM